MRKTFLSYKTNGIVIQEKLMDMNITISLESAKAIAKAIRTPMWDWHYYFGFALVLFFVYRIIIGFKNLKEEKEILKKFIHILFYIMLGFMVISGTVLYFYKIEFLKELHEISMFSFLIFIPLHILAVIKAEYKHGNIIQKMIK